MYLFEYYKTDVLPHPLYFFLNWITLEVISVLTWPENWIPVNGKILKSEHILTKSLLILSAYNTNQKTSKCKKKKKLNNVFLYYYYYFRLIYGIICDPPFEERSSCLALTQLSSAPWLTFTPLSSLCKYTFSKKSLITVL